MTHFLVHFLTHFDDYFNGGIADKYSKEGNDPNVCWQGKEESPFANSKTWFLCEKRHWLHVIGKGKVDHLATVTSEDEVAKSEVRSLEI